MSPLISIVIPTWQGADVIQDAIRGAQSQSLDNLEIIVSIDHCSDDTAALAHEAARSDPRIQVVEHTARCGWVRNVNSALERVTGELFFLYFHDDLIQEDYLEHLSGALAQHPGAMCAYCAVEQDSGEQVFLDRGRAYGGEPLQRMLDRLLLPQAGAPLRALTRRQVLDQGLRFPEGSQQGFHAQHAYLLDLIGRADAVYVDLPLYRRRNWRPGALTKGWLDTPLSTLTDDLRIVSQTMLRTAGALVSSSHELALVRTAIGLRLLPLLRGVEVRQQSEDLSAPGHLVPSVDLELALPGRWSSHADRLKVQIHELEDRWRQARDSGQ